MNVKNLTKRSGHFDLTDSGLFINYDNEKLFIKAGAMK
jgi:hypothetical protein